MNKTHTHIQPHTHPGKTTIKQELKRREFTQGKCTNERIYSNDFSKENIQKIESAK